MRFVHRPTTMTAIQWDGKPQTVGKMLTLGVDFRTSKLETISGPRLIGYIARTHNHKPLLVDPGDWVTKDKTGRPRVLKPHEMTDWEPVAAASHRSRVAVGHAEPDAVIAPTGKPVADMTDDEYAAWYAAQCVRLDL